MFNSRGFKDAAAVKGSELEESLMEASQGGKLPIVMDTSPCLATLKGSLSTSALRCCFSPPLPPPLSPKTPPHHHKVTYAALPVLLQWATVDIR